jgi:lipoyl synthase
MELPTATPRKGGKPSWIRMQLPSGETYNRIKSTLKTRRLFTVCEEAKCPNLGECWNGGTATFMVMGGICTRGCRFCAVTTRKEGLPLDLEEPEKVSESIAAMELNYVVITSVDRDDLSDGGAAHFANIIRQVNTDHPECLVEVLTPDFQGNKDQISIVSGANPNVFAHNIETVRRTTPKVRDPRATYDQSLEVLKFVKDTSPSLYTKSSIMVGVGENEDEMIETMRDLRNVGVSFLTIGQYLQPTPKHMSVAEYIHPDQFKKYETLGLELGFDYVASGPLVRSSYRAGEFYIRNRLKNKIESVEINPPPL